MEFADFALTCRGRKVAHPSGPTMFSVCSAVDFFEQERLSIFQVSPYGITTKVGDLHHAGQLTIDEKRSFDNSLDVCPKRPFDVKVPHQQSVFSLDGLVIVMHEKPVIALTPCFIRVAKISLKP